MRKIIPLILVILLKLEISAQDQLFRTDNTKILVKIIEVGTEMVKYKLFEDQNGPVHVETKNNIALIIYENGQHEVFSEAAPGNKAQNTSHPKKRSLPFSPDDSSSYYSYENNLSVNFMYLFNNEVGFIYRREFFYNSFNLIVPFAFGISKPGVTQEAYFNTNPVRINLQRKIFEVGVGMNYYPTLKTKNNYYIGPAVRYMQYDVTQEAMSWPAYLIASNKTVLSRYAFSITNGVVFRTRSRLTTDLFLSVGFKNDKVRDQLYDPVGDPITTLPDPTSLYWWSGFLVGFSF
jgi:hypothetical protein